MKIAPTNIITISGKTGLPDQMRGIQKGEELPARIVERISRREAILEISGKRINAEFRKGVPAGNMITLKLDGIKNNAVFFSMVEPGGKEALAKHLAGLTIFDMNQLQKDIIYGMSAALGKHPAGILELNMLLLGLHQKQGKKEEGPARFLAFLMKLGIDKNVVADLSILLSGMNTTAQAFKSLLLIMGFDAERIRKWSSGKTGDIEGIIDAITKEFSAMDSKEDLETSLRQLLGLLEDAGTQSTGYASGNLALYNEDQLTPIQYIGKDNAWLFSIDFSGIGRIEILARESSDGYLVSVFSETSEALEALRKSAEQLQKNLNGIHPGIHINFYNTRLAINKIVEIYSYYSLNSEFDIRV